MLQAFGGGTSLRGFPLVGAAQSRVSDTPLPAEERGYASIRSKKHFQETKAVKTAQAVHSCPRNVNIRLTPSEGQITIS